MSRTFLIGVDASIKSAGVAVYNPQNNDLKLFSGSLIDCLTWINDNSLHDKSIAVVENADLDSATFVARRTLFSLINRFKRNLIAEKELYSGLTVLMKRSQHVGKSQAAAQVFIQYFNAMQVPVVQIAPSERMRADKPMRRGSKILPVGIMTMPTKTSAYQFKQLTGYSGTSNEHTRDAATLVWGKSIEWAVLKLKMQHK